MKTFNISLKLNRARHSLATCLAATVAGAIVMLGAPVQAGQSSDRDRNDLREAAELIQKAEVADLLQLLADYHGALAYGGDQEAMASLWAEQGTLTLNNGTPYVGKQAVLGFFTSGPYFSHYWVSLAPEWKTTITVHGDTAETTTECIATDVSVTPNVIKGVIQVNATCEKRHGKWLFIRMNNITLPEL